MNTPSAGNRLLIVGGGRGQGRKYGAEPTGTSIWRPARVRPALLSDSAWRHGQSYALGVNQSEVVVGDVVLTRRIGKFSSMVAGRLGAIVPQRDRYREWQCQRHLDAGEIVGFGVGQPAVWDGQIRTDLSTFGGNGSGQALGVNASGVVVGASRYFGDQNSRAFV